MAAQSLRDVGEDPDPRFTFANERTFLRLEPHRAGADRRRAGGRPAARLRLRVRPPAASLLPPILLGGILALTSYRRWEANERAMRLKEPLPTIGPPRFVPPAIALLALVIAVLVIVGAIRA